jgi:tRNA dimethylallyltransferase
VTTSGSDPRSLAFDRTSPPDAPLLVVLGPTATGKSELAEHLALRLEGEIVGVDSMQVYRGLNAGTFKPSLEARRRVPHHLIDVADPRRDFNLGDFVRAADAAVGSIRGRGRLPILAGGTGMYLRGFLRGLDPAPPRDPRLRAALEALGTRRGERHLHRILAAHDPAAASRIGIADRMRLVRALERVLRSGRAEGRDAWSGPERHASVKVGLRPASAALGRRIDARVEAMFAAGIVAETAALLAAGVPPEGSALKALGYRAAVAHLRGRLDLATAMAETKRQTRQFARRQMTWFRSEPEVRWFAPEEGDAAPLRLEVEKYVRLRLGR